MTYAAKAAVCSEIRKNTQRKASSKLNFSMLKRVVRREAARV
jgi:hypothetical protein